MCAPLLSGVILALAFPRYDQSWVAWVGLVPLLVGICGLRPWQASLISGLVGIVYFVGVFHWILAFPGFTLLHQTILGIYVGIYFALFGLTFSFLSGRCGPATALVAAPFIWVPLECIRSNLYFMSLPWGLLGHSQYACSHIIQVASVAGVYGVSFLIIMVNAALAAIVLYVVFRSRKADRGFLPPVTRKGAGLIVATTGGIIVLALSYGGITLARPIEGTPIKISVVQGNIEQGKKWDPRYAELIMQTYADLTKGASEDRPALIIWPETSTPRAINLDVGLYTQVRRIAREAKTYLLIGSAQQQKIKKKNPKDVKYLNSAFLIPPDPRAKTQKYDKIRLMAFGEYLPLEGVIPWSSIKVPEVGSYVPGKEFTVFKTPNFSFGVTICWESLFPDLVRRFVLNGAQFMVNITNEAWFGKTDASYQFASMNVFRAVENRVYLVRCANTGISCFIDPYGRIVDRVKDVKGQDIFVRGVLTRRVTPMESQTIYTRYGDILVWLSVLCSAGFLLMAFTRKRRRVNGN